MLVKTMTHEQIRAQVKADVDQIAARLQYQLHGWYRMALKRRSFPWSFSVKGTTANGNDYIACLKTSSLAELKHRGLYLNVFVKFVTDEGTAYANLCDTVSGSWDAYYDDKTISHLNIYTPHMFSRYFERFGKQDGYENIYEQFFLRLTYAANKAGDFNGLHGEKYDVMSIIPDGILYGTSDNFEKDVTWRTFLRTDQLNKKQMNYVQESAKKHLALSIIYKQHEDKYYREQIYQKKYL